MLGVKRVVPLATRHHELSDKLINHHPAHGRLKADLVYLVLNKEITYWMCEQGEGYFLLPRDKN